MVATVVVHVVNLPAQLTVGAILKHWVTTDTLHVEGIFPWLPDFGGQGSSLLYVCLWQSWKFFLGIYDDVSIVCIVHQVLGELKGQFAQFLVDFLHFILVLLAQQGTTVHKTLVSGFKQFLLLLVQVPFALVVIDVLDLAEKVWVHIDEIAVSRSQWGNLTGQGTELIVGIRAAQGTVHATSLG